MVVVAVESGVGEQRPCARHGARHQNLRLSSFRRAISTFMLSFSGTLTRDATAALQLRFTLESALSQLTNLTSEADALNLEIRALRRVHANSSDGGVDSDEHDLFVRARVATCKRTPGRSRPCWSMR